MLIALLLIGCVALATAIGFFAMKAPIGYQDQSGFHRVCIKPIHDQRGVLSLLQFPLAKSALGIAALLIMLLLISPTSYDSNENQTSVKMSSKQLASEPVLTNPRLSVTGGEESGKIFQTLCQRFNQIE